MKRRIGNCPACGGPLEFELSTALVKVCDFCQSVVARTDKRLEDHGKVADLAETDSPIRRGVTGKFEKKRFDVVGRVQYRHPAGGAWNEWYLKFPEDRVRWLAEAQGRLYLTVEKRRNDAATLPDYDLVSAGDNIELSDGKSFAVAEKGIGTALAAEGEIPWSLRPNEEHRFVDLHGPNTEFATIEYGDARPRVYLGREISLDELQLAFDDGELVAPPSPNTGALQINCPHCAGPLTLYAPDQTERVCCPSCKSLLDCQQGKLEYLQTLKMRGAKPLIPLGQEGQLNGVRFTVIGFMERYVKYLGKSYPWTEYLLYNRELGFRWLVNSEQHWSFVEPLRLNQVQRRPDRTAIYNNKPFRLYDRGTAFVRVVLGEFYWRVEMGEQVETSDYIAPPQMISFEQTTTGAGDELNISLGTHIDTDGLRDAFQAPTLPVAWGFGTVQPQPDRSEVWMMWLGFVVLLILLDVTFTSGTLNHPVSQFYFYAALAAVSVWPIGLLVVRHFVEVNRWRDSDSSPYSSGESDD